jgi:hypothetical protein
MISFSEKDLTELFEDLFTEFEDTHSTHLKFYVNMEDGNFRFIVDVVFTLENEPSENTYNLLYSAMNRVERYTKTKSNWLHGDLGINNNLLFEFICKDLD